MMTSEGSTAIRDSARRSACGRPACRPVRVLLLVTLLALVAPVEATAAGRDVHVVSTVWVPPQPPPVSPSVGPARSLSESRKVGIVHLVWTKGLQTGCLALHLGHLFSELAGRDASSLLLPETILLWGHGATNFVGPWGYAMALDDGSPPARHRGLGIGLLEQSLYSALIATIEVLTRQLFLGPNGCHLPDPRGCLDSYYPRVSTPQTVIWYSTAGLLFGFSMLHLAAAAQLQHLHDQGLLGDSVAKAGRPSRPRCRPARARAVVRTRRRRADARWAAALNRAAPDRGWPCARTGGHPGLEPVTSRRMN